MSDMQETLITLMQRLHTLQLQQVRQGDETPTEVLSEITRLEAELASLQAQRTPQAQADHHTFDDEAAVFLKTSGGGQSQHTQTTYRSGLRYLRAYLFETQNWSASHPIAALHAEMLQEYPAWLLQQTYKPSEHAAPEPLAESSRSLYVLTATRFVRFLVLRQRLPLIDFVAYERIKEELGKATRPQAKPIAQKIPSEEVVSALIEAVKRPPPRPETESPTETRRTMLSWRRNIAIILALKSSGMRVGEVVTLKRGDLDEARQGAWVTGKGRKTRFVAFDDEAWEAIHAYLLARQDETLGTRLAGYPLFCRHNRSAGANKRLPLSVRSVQQLMNRLVQDADLDKRFNLSPHSLRHYFANSLLQHTENLALVQDALGHQSPATTRVYTKTDVDAIARSVRAMSERKHDAEAD